MIDHKLNYYIQKAGEMAQQNSHEYLTPEHIFYVILELEPAFVDLLDRCGLKEIKALMENIQLYISQIPKADKTNHPTLSLVLENIIKNIPAKGEFDTKDFMLTLLDDNKSPLAQILKFHGINLQRLKNELKSSKQPKEAGSSLQKYTINLVELAKAGKLDPLIGRQKEIQKTLETLCRRKKNNPILVGEAGVGKTAIVDGIAIKIAQNDVPQRLQNAAIYALDCGSLIAGAKFRGDFEERVKEILSELKKIKNSILFIDEIHTTIGTGATGDSTLDMGNLLKPALASGDIKCIGATTYAEYRDFSKDKALSRRFGKIDIDEPSVDESFEILKGLRHKYEEFHGVKYSDAILKHSAEYAKRYLNDRFLPDSAIDLIDEVGASLSTKQQNRAVCEEDLKEILSISANLQNLSISSDNSQILKDLDIKLKERIFGQNEAVLALHKALIRSYAGLKNPNSPIGVFLFAGSSGVGKTELAKELANALGVHFERVDMSEFMQAHDTSKLIGAAPGYVGFENGGTLTNNIKKHPYSVVLLDEIEKAAPEVMNLFLQIFDDARLSDNRGETTDFKNTIIIMTSNLGNKFSPLVGFNKKAIDQTDSAIREFFSPEFRNRIDQIIHFAHLGEVELSKIVEKSLSEIAANLKDKKVEIQADEAAKQHLIKIGYSDEFGARNLKRTISAQISDEISKELLFGSLKDGGRVWIGFDGTKLTYSFMQIEKFGA